MQSMVVSTRQTVYAVILVVFAYPFAIARDVSGQATSAGQLRLLKMHAHKVRLMGVHLRGVHLMGVHFLSVLLIGVHLMGVHIWACTLWACTLWACTF
jgi:hypothetical protein